MAMNFQDKVLNFKISPNDNRDFTVDKVSSSSLQLNVDLSPYCTSVKDQGNIGSCTAYAGISMFEYNRRKHFKDLNKDINQDIFSEIFTYYTTRVNIANDKPEDDNGAYIRDTLKSLILYGSCLEKTWSSNKLFFETPSQEAYNEGKKYQALTYLNIPVGNSSNERKTTLNTLRGLLQNGYLFIGGFRCYSNLNSGRNGIIPLPSGSIIGGHAVCFVGYDDTKQVFKFKNSWSKDWGDNGYGYLPYSYLLSGDLLDLWTIMTQEENDSEIGIVKPKTSKEIMDSTIAKGLVSISLNETPVIPSSGITSRQRLSLLSFFNRVMLMKRQI